jgi:hypothetical protein
MFTKVSCSVALLGMGVINLILAQQTIGQFQVESLSGDAIGYLSASDQL